MADALTMDNSPSLSPGLYIHVPFCKSKCPYCDFFSVTDLSRREDYLAAACREMSSWRGVFPPFDSIYLGGGTPSLLDERDFGRLWANIQKNFLFTKDLEVTMEVNPGLSDSYLRFLRLTGVNRIIVGVQSLNEQTLAFLGRPYLPRQALETVAKAQAAGFDNIGIDLIYGCPTENPDEFLAALKIWEGSSIQHISCYQLTLKEPTPLALRLAKGEFTLPDEDEEWRYFRDISLKLQDMGFTHYEVSNFARSDAFKSRHNSKYWRHVPYLGIGPAAHSFRGDRRWWNPSSLEDYFDLVESNSPPVRRGETLSREELAFESLFLGLRMADGIDLNDWSGRYGENLASREEISASIRLGLLEFSGNRLKPTLKGMALADRLAILLAGS